MTMWPPSLPLVLTPACTALPVAVTLPVVDLMVIYIAGWVFAVPGLA
jgi:hypothetical protein